MVDDRVPGDPPDPRVITELLLQLSPADLEAMHRTASEALARLSDSNTITLRPESMRVGHTVSSPGLEVAWVELRAPAPLPDGSATPGAAFDQLPPAAASFWEEVRPKSAEDMNAYLQTLLKYIVWVTALFVTAAPIADGLEQVQSQVHEQLNQEESTSE